MTLTGRGAKELTQHEEEQHMHYVTNAERIGFERGIQRGILQGMQAGREEGKQEGERALLVRILIRRFGPLPIWALEQLEKAGSTELETWTETALDTVTLESVFVPTAGMLS
ncbi:hypothetical protein CCP3SC15_180020 [Gammaproteobacteria bacterium]